MIPILCSPNNPIDTCCKCCIVTRQDLCQKPNKSFARSLQWMDMLQKKPAAVWNSVSVWSNWECWVTYKWSVSGSTVSVINLTKYEISRFTVTGGDKGRIADGQITWTIRRLLRLDAAKTVINWSFSVFMTPVLPPLSLLFPGTVVVVVQFFLHYRWS